MAGAEPNDGSESEHTSYDSDQVEEADSEIEFSRVMPSPGPQREQPRSQVKNSSTPRTQRAAPWNRRQSQQTQQTQELAPLSGTQLRALMEDDDEEPEEDQDQDQKTIEEDPEREIDDATVNLSELLGKHDDDEHDETGVDRSSILGAGKGTEGPGDETDGKLEYDEPIDTDGIAPLDLEEERILSSADESGNPEADVTPVNAASGDSQRMKLPGYKLIDGDYVEETPMKLLSMPTPPSHYAYVLVKWGRDPNWWPARADKHDFQIRNKKATVTFRLDQIGVVDLSKSHKFELRKGDQVRIMSSGDGKRSQTSYTVSGLKVSPDVAATIITVDHFNRAVLEGRSTGAKSTKSRSRLGAKKTIEVDVADIYLTNKNMEAWLDVRAGDEEKKKFSTPKRARVGSNDLERSVELTSSTSPRKRRVLAGSPQRKVGRFGAHLDFDEDSVIGETAVSPRTPRVSPKKQAETSPLRSKLYSASRNLFSSAIFSITISNKNLKMRDKSPVVARLPSLIESHGGRVLSEGLSQVVKLSDMSEEDGSMPDLEYDFGAATFAAVLADTPRRTLKYLEMLALGWPCLHYQYILDCLNENEILDWRPYLLPAGEVNLAQRKMSVSCDTYAFYRRWLYQTPLDEQMRRRRIPLRCSVPLCILSKFRNSSPESDSHKRMLVTMSAPLYRTWFYSDADSIPQGSLILELDRTSNFEVANASVDTDPEVLSQIKNYAAADESIHKDLEWFIQCLINGGLL